MSDSILKALSDTEILGLTIIGEARGEPIQGQIAVGCVIRNRAYSSTEHKTYQDVCLEPEQFSCWNNRDINNPMLLELASKIVTGGIIIDAYYKQCMWVASGIINQVIIDNTGGATHYLTQKLFASDARPKWAKVPRGNPINIGRQVFFNV